MFQMLPLFRKSHIHSRAIEDYLKCGYIQNYSEEQHKRNALRQAGGLYRMVSGELFRHGTEKEYRRYGLRMVIHDDQPDRKAEIIRKCHIDPLGNHCGMNVTMKNVTETYYWQGISSHVKLYMKECEACKVRSKMTAEEWVENERQSQVKRKSEAEICKEAKEQIKNLGKIKKPSPPETFFIVNAESKISEKIEDRADVNMVIDSNNIEYVVETLGHMEDGADLQEICHVLNVPDIVPTPERYRSREIENFLKYGSFPPGFTCNQKNGLKNPASQYIIIDDELYHDGNKIGSKGVRLVVHDDTAALKVKIIVENHMDEDGSHYGMNKTIRKIGEKYFWTGMCVDVRRFMMHCQICHSNRAKRSLLQNIEGMEDEYKNQVSFLKTKHDQKMAAKDESYLQTEVEEVHSIPLDDNEDTEEREVQTVSYAEGGEETDSTYNHVIKLLGPNQEVTEITVAVRKSKMEDGSVAEKMVVSDQLEETTEELVTEPVNIVQVETTEQQIETTEQEMQVEGSEEQILEQEAVNAINGGEQTQEAVRTRSVIKTESGQYVEIENAESGVIYQEESNDANAGNNIIQIQPLESGETEQTQEVVQVQEEFVTEADEDGDELVQVVVINEDGAEEHKTFRKDELRAVSDLITTAEEIEARGTDGNKDSEQTNIVQYTTSTSHSGQFYYYKDLIYCPKNVKTRTVESFLKLGHTRGHHFFPQLTEVAANFQIVDDVLCRRHNRCKNGLVVVHDDQPEVWTKFVYRVSFSQIYMALLSLYLFIARQSSQILGHILFIDHNSDKPISNTLVTFLIDKFM